MTSLRTSAWEATVSEEDRWVTTLLTAAKETTILSSLFQV